LYYHPDLQRVFIYELIESIKRIKLKNIKNINCIFVTHSPFILSDIPHHNILFLDIDGNPILDLNVKTFGANIHDLLKHSFFLKEGSMGEFAKRKINDTINWLNYMKLKKNIEMYSDSGVRKDKALLKLKEQEINTLKKEVEIFDETTHKKIIEIIDEPILKIKLSELYDEVVGSEFKVKIIERKIEELMKEKEKITQKRK